MFSGEIERPEVIILFYFLNSKANHELLRTRPISVISVICPRHFVFLTFSSMGKAKRIDKKRSTSVDERKSALNTSSDDSSHSQLSADSDDEARNAPKSVIESSLKVSRKSLKSSQRSDKSRGNSRSKDDKKSSSKSVRRTTLPAEFSPSSNDEDTTAKVPTSSRKSKKTKSNSKPRSGSSKGLRSDSSDDSISEFEDEKARSHFTGRDNSPTQNKKLQTKDVYSDSESSSNSSSQSRRQLSKKSKKGKQRSMSKVLFEDSTESSESESSRSVFKKDAVPTFSKNKLKGKENKLTASVSVNSSRKKHHGHSSSVVKSNKPPKRPREERNLSKRESTSNMEQFLFGSVTESSSEERPKTPSISPHPSVPSSPKHHVSRPSSPKHHGSRPSSPKHHVSNEIAKKPVKEKKKDRSLKIHSSSVEEPEVAAAAAVTTTISTESKSNSSHGEKRKKKHHKEKRSKREGESSSSKKVSPVAVKAEPMDYKSLFSPPASPDGKQQEKKSNRMKRESSAESSAAVALKKTAPPSPVCPAVVQPTIILPTEMKMESELEVEAPKKVTATNDAVELCETAIKESGMFSTDDEDDDDNKLKIDINEVIMASASSDDAEDEEEKKRKSLFEQDKAIQSIVCFDQKLPSPVPVRPEEEEVLVKDDSPKDETAISQEETEGAVAALLETLEGDDSNVVDDKGPGNAPRGLQSPPTLRIIEEPADVKILTSVPEQPKGPKVADERAPWLVEASRAAKSPKQLITMTTTVEDVSGAASSAEIEAAVASLGVDTDKKEDDEYSCTNSLPKTPDICKNILEGTAGSKPVSRRGSSHGSRAGSVDAEQDLSAGFSADVYEFHDSDDESSAKRRKAAVSPPKLSPTGTKSPVVSTTPTLLVPVCMQSSVAPPVPIVVPTAFVPPVTTASISPRPTVATTILSPTSSGIIPPVISTTPVVSLATEPMKTSPSPHHVLSVAIPPVSIVSTPSPSKGHVKEKSVSPRGCAASKKAASLSRTTVDDAIDDVIRKASEDPESLVLPAVAMPNILGAVGTRNSRSRSRDTPEEVGSSPFGGKQGAGRGQVREQQQQAIPRPFLQNVTTITENDAAMRQLQSPQAAMVPTSRPGEDLHRSANYRGPPNFPVGANITPLMESANLPKISIPSSTTQFQVKEEGLPAILAQEQQQRAQQHQQKTFSMYSASGQKIIHGSSATPPARSPLTGHPNPAQLLIQTSSISQSMSPKSVTIIYTSSPLPMSPSVRSGTHMPQTQPHSPGIVTSTSGHLVPVGSHHSPTTPSRSPMVVSSMASGHPHHMSSSPYAGPPGTFPVIRDLHHDISGSLPRNIPSPSVSKSSGPIPTDLVYQIPKATTVTKVDHSNASGGPVEEQHARATMVSVGRPITSVGNLVSVKVGAPAPSGMTLQQQRQHQAQTELFRRSAEGALGGLIPKEEGVMGKTQVRIWMMMILVC